MNRIDEKQKVKVIVHKESTFDNVIAILAFLAVVFSIFMIVTFWPTIFSLIDSPKDFLKFLPMLLSFTVPAIFLEVKNKIPVLLRPLIVSLVVTFFTELERAIKSGFSIIRIEGIEKIALYYLMFLFASIPLVLALFIIGFIVRSIIRAVEKHKEN